ncbi:MAG: hypothetical protein RLZZ359_1023 [Actinomycetota bacterium]
MRKALTILLGLSLAITLGACASSDGEAQNPDSSVQAIPTPDPALIPEPAAAGIPEADPAVYSDGFGDFVFKVGDGPTWCSISPESGFVLCEHNEAAASYPTIPVPATCDYSFGYQVRLWASGQKLSVPPFNCYVDEITARCENESGKYIALGPEVWALGN